MASECLAPGRQGPGGLRTLRPGQGPPLHVRILRHQPQPPGSARGATAAGSPPSALTKIAPAPTAQEGDLERTRAVKCPPASSRQQQAAAPSTRRGRPRWSSSNERTGHRPENAHQQVPASRRPSGQRPGTPRCCKAVDCLRLTAPSLPPPADHRGHPRLLGLLWAWCAGRCSTSPTPRPRRKDRQKAGPGAADRIGSGPRWVRRVLQVTGPPWRRPAVRLITPSSPPTCSVLVAARGGRRSRGHADGCRESVYAAGSSPVGRSTGARRSRAAGARRSRPEACPRGTDPRSGLGLAQPRGRDCDCQDR